MSGSELLSNTVVCQSVAKSIMEERQENKQIKHWCFDILLQNLSAHQFTHSDIICGQPTIWERLTCMCASVCMYAYIFFVVTRDSQWMCYVEKDNSYLASYLINNAHLKDMGKRECKWLLAISNINAELCWLTPDILFTAEPGIVSLQLLKITVTEHGSVETQEKTLTVHSNWQTATED